MVFMLLLTSQFILSCTVTTTHHQADIMLSSAHTNLSSLGTWSYFAYTAAAGHSTIRVQIAQRVGAVEVFATKCLYFGACMASDLPSTTHYLRNVTNLKSGIEIARYDTLDSSYIVGALSRRSNFTAYLLTVTLEDNILALQSGVAVYERVNKGDQRHFSFTPPLGVMVKIQLSEIYGDADLYVSTKWPRPTAANR